MRPKTIALLALYTSIGVTQAAFAADMPVKAPVYKAIRTVAPADNWSGFYFGGHIGGAWTNNSFSDPLGVIAPGGAVVSAKDSGLLGGAQLGFNWQYNWFVAGIQGDIGFTDLDANATVP